ncbi:MULTISPECIES: protein-export chaperone SecB [Novosphingobium]|uniref:Protein-export protein SecB n=1 Tax=Novosphingobium mangrovi (ex Hu et al. 2023) TaxID=2930094 RepID=A0ABT0AFM0_9SPHN|nr:MULTISPECIES: protein-export chaperone SecB [Novosphingobium]MCJ1961982.1 protein-export chaperone SecB [Novosphingobium mangrovi (ex Hu et al. 2023)]
MADEGNVISDLNLGNGGDAGPSAGIISQYIKDLSVENPNAPQSFQWQDTPAIDVQFNIAAKAIEGEVHEVELKITCASKCEAGTAFVVDLSYCALVGMRGLDDGQAHAFLFAEAPRILFPFARRVVADAVRDAGFQPLMLEPIDFNGLYVQQLQAQQQQGATAGDPPMGNA